MPQNVVAGALHADFARILRWLDPAGFCALDSGVLGSSARI
ncbi:MULTISPECIES: hypothetical protein [unclassified Helicobacter]|nr:MULTISPECIES: hypothetical protein [unclassified Helicobacter]